MRKSVKNKIRQYRVIDIEPDGTFSTIFAVSMEAAFYQMIESYFFYVPSEKGIILETHEIREGVSIINYLFSSAEWTCIMEDLTILEKSNSLIIPGDIFYNTERGDFIPRTPQEKLEKVKELYEKEYQT